MALAPKPPSEPRDRRGRRRRLLVGALLGALVAVAGWFPFVAWRERRSDAQAQAHVQALVDEGFPVELAALDERPARDAGPLVEALVARLAVTEAEDEAARREASWRTSPGWTRDPNGPSPPPLADDEAPDEGGPRWDPPERYAAADHTAIVTRLLLRLDAETPALDALLGCDGCSVPPPLLNDLSSGAREAAWTELGGLLRLRALAWGDAPWATLARWGRLVALLRNPAWAGSCLQSSELAAVAVHVELALSRAPLDPAVVPALDEALRRAERTDALSVGLRCFLQPMLSYLSADRAAFDRLEAELERPISQPLGEPSWTFRAFLRRRTAPLRYLAYLEDRPRGARLQADAVRAAARSLREVERRFEELGEEARASGGPVSHVVANNLPSPSLPYERRARTRLARMALAWAAAAGAAALPAAPPLLLDDPLTEPPRPLRWRRDGDRSFTLWGVGDDRVDDEAARPAEPDGPEKDLTLRVTLP